MNKVRHLKSVYSLCTLTTTLGRHCLVFLGNLRALSSEIYKALRRNRSFRSLLPLLDIEVERLQAELNHRLTYRGDDVQHRV